MIINLFFKECYTDLRKLESTLGKIEKKNHQDRIDKYENALMEIDLVIRNLKSAVEKHKFSSIVEEIRFFKEIKPKFIAQFIYYSKLLSLEVAKPNTGQSKSMKEYYETEWSAMRNFYTSNFSFYEYYRRKATYLDQKYFVRNEFDLKTEIGEKLYDFDEKFTTSHDHLVAQIMAYEKLEVFLLKMISEKEGDTLEKTINKSPVFWSGSKVSLVELMYGLHQMRCFNGGNIDLSEIIRTTEKLLNIDLSNFHKVLNEIRSRKTGRTKFLQLLNESLEQHFTDLDQ